MYWLPYNKDLKEFSRRLRKNSTLGEILLWQKLRAGSMMNYTFWIATSLIFIASH